MADEAIKNVRLDFAESDHARLRVAAAKAGMPMAHYAREAVLKAIAADEPAEAAEPPSKRRGRPRKGGGG